MYVYMDERLERAIQFVRALGFSTLDPSARVPGLRSRVDKSVLDALDLDALAAHMLDCAAVMRTVQHTLRHVHGGADSVVRLQRAKATVLSHAVEMLLTNDDGLEPAAAALVEVFPDEGKATDGRGWLPLHWAVVLHPQLRDPGALDVIYSANPLAFQQTSRRVPTTGAAKTSFGYTPAHLLCFRRCADVQLIHTFMTRDIKAFKMRCSDKHDADPVAQQEAGRHCLHLVASVGEDPELLRCLLQVDASQTRKRDPAFGGGYPIKALCQRPTPFASFAAMFNCLLDCDKDAEYIAGALKGCALSFKALRDGVDPIGLLTSTAAATSSSAAASTLSPGRKRSFTQVFDEQADQEIAFFGEKVALMERLLRAHPAVAAHRFPDGENLLHVFAGYVDHRLGWCTRLLALVLAQHPAAAQERDAEGNLPLHAAARHNRAVVIEYLLSQAPPALPQPYVNAHGSNLLHVVACDRDSSAAAVREKAHLLYTRHPELLRLRDSNGLTPLHIACEHGTLSLDLLALEPAAIHDRVHHPTNAEGDSYERRLPLHVFVLHQHVPTPDCAAADVLRALLRLHPAAAGEEDSSGMTPYDLASMGRSNSNWLRRLLLSAAPLIDPSELHCLNWAERRTALFLAERAITATIKPTIFARLRFANKDLIHRVVSFL